jgi:hypothetical protein
MTTLSASTLFASIVLGAGPILSGDLGPPPVGSPWRFVVIGRGGFWLDLNEEQYQSLR